MTYDPAVQQSSSPAVQQASTARTAAGDLSLVCKVRPKGVNHEGSPSDCSVPACTEVLGYLG